MVRSPTRQGKQDPPAPGDAPQRRRPPASDGDGTEEGAAADCERRRRRRRSVVVVRPTPRSVGLSLLAGTVAFLAGAASRRALLPDAGGTRASPATCASDGTTAARLPRPTVREGKDVPVTTFVNKIFGREGATTTNHTVHLDRTSFRVDEKQEEDEDEDEEEDEEEDGEDVGDDGPRHLPSGQHLLVDIKHVDPAFLDSEPRLAAAMVELVHESKLTLLSYHCHALVPSGVSCAGILLESHVAFHTWPKQGVVSLDLFTCGSGLLIPLLPAVKRLFGVPASRDDDDASSSSGRDVPRPAPAMAWSHKLRGFREGFTPSYKKHENPLEQDLRTLLDWHDLEGRKASLVSEGTDFQHVDVHRLVDPRHNAPRVPDKVLFLDGVHQSSLHGDAAYHEALVHPAMVAHPDPRRVAIIGGGEGATLREVLKHRTVEEAKMVEIDGELVGLCREHLAEWSDCSDIAGGDADSCFDDSRASLAFEDAFGWFMDSFGKEEEIEEEKFDVIIMDALDPDQFVEIVGDLYKDNKFVGALFNGLNEDGVFVIQLGQADTSDEPAEDVGQSQDAANMRRGLENAGFQSMHIYDEGHSHFEAPWSYLLCLKDSQTRANWFRGAAEIELALHQRLHRTKSGKPPLSFFDGSTMVGYQLPPKPFETVYCRSEEEPWECDTHIGVHPEWNSIPMSHLEARKSTVGQHAGRGLFAATDIPEHHAFDIGNGVRAFQILPSPWSTIEDLHRWAGGHEGNSYVKKELSSVVTFAQGYGYGSMLLGTEHWTVDSGITTFCNHGCNGTYNYGNEEKEAGVTEMNVPLDHAPWEFHNDAWQVYSPVLERHLRQLLSVGDYTLRDIRRGEEILCDYLGFGGHPDEWGEYITNLRGECSGQQMGDVAAYEQD